MKVLKRNGRGSEEVKFDKIVNRIRYLCNGLNASVDPVKIAIDTIKNIYDGISTEELDRISASIAESYKLIHPDYAILAGRICASNLHKTTPGKFSDCMNQIGNTLKVKSIEHYRFIQEYATQLDNMIIHENDYNFDYFGFKTLENAYLVKHKYQIVVNNKQQFMERIIDRPQYIWMRVAVAIYMNYDPNPAVCLENIKQCYKALSQMYFTHATPTLFNACMHNQQLNSCFIADTEVCTTSGVKRIQDVSVGDYVFTHVGNIKRVEQTHVNTLNNRTIYAVKVQKTPIVKVTNDHKFWAIRKHGDIPAWWRIDELLANSYIAIPNCKDDQFQREPMIIDLFEYITDELSRYFIYDATHINWSARFDSSKGQYINPNSINRKWLANEKFWEFIGIWLYGGHIAYLFDDPTAVGFIVNSVNNDNLIDFIVNEGKRIFGVNAVIMQIENQTIRISFYSQIIAMTFENLFGKEKHLWAQMYTLHPIYVNSLIIGLIATNISAGFICIEMTNQSLLKEIYHLCRNRGLDVSYSMKIGKINSTAIINLSLEDKFNKNQAVIYNGQKFLKIKCKILLNEHPEYVYTLGVADDHSYNVEGLAAANCFLLGRSDSIEEIMRTLSNASFISKWAGGIGIWMHCIRAQNAYIKGTNGRSSGLPRQLKMYNEAARCWDQGGKRLGAFSIYLEPWHADIMPFLKLKLNTGAETERARDLFYALWVCDLFIKRVNEDSDWSLFSEDTAPGLSDVYDGMEICTKCGFCQNRNYVKFMHNKNKPPPDSNYTIEEDINIEKLFKKTVAEFAHCEHNYERRNVFTELYERYEREGLAMKVIKARDVVEAIITMQRESGTPYICFKDHVNRKSNQSNIGTIKSSNLCVVPETMILTDKGQYPIVDLVNKEINIWNGTEFSKVTPRQTNTSQAIIRVNLSNGAFIDCTKYHKFAVIKDTKTLKIEAADLQPGDILIDYTLPTIDGDESFKYPYRSGILCSYSGDDEERPVHSELEPRFAVPMNASIKIKLQWLAGFMDVSGFIVDLDHSYLVEMTASRKEFLINVRLMLQTLGVKAEILTIEHKLITNMIIKTYYKLTIMASDIMHLLHLGLQTVYLKFKISKTCAAKSVQVESVVNSGRISDTYCFTETGRGLGMFNGILTYNCTEIMEWSSEYSYACCTLASINLKKYLIAGENNPDGSIKYRIDHEKLHEMTRLIIRNLDIITDINNSPVVECEHNSKTFRPVAVGIMSVADVFCEMRLPFLSPEAARHDIEITETISHAAYEESMCRAKLLGPYKEFAGSPASYGKLSFDLWEEDIKARGVDIFAGSGITGIISGRYDWADMKLQIMKYGLRNSLLIAYMPTVSTSQIMGSNESFEPYSSNIYTKTTLVGKFTMSNNIMIRHLISLGIWNEDFKNRIISADGSINVVDSDGNPIFPEIPREVREIYQTVWELSQKEIMRRTAIRGAFVDQSQSLNIHIRDNSSKYLRAILLTAWEFGLKTGSYYVRSKPATTVMKNNLSVIRRAETTQEEFECKLEPGCTSCAL